jgi:hypothetical protein
MDTSDQAHLERPALARSSGGEQLGELRQDCPRWILNVLDAVSMARGDKARTALVVEILGEYAKRKSHEAMLIHRLSGGNPQTAETHGGRAP